MTPEEARLVMKGWLDNQSQLAFVGSLFGFGAFLSCKVVELTEEHVKLLTGDGGRLVIDLSDPLLAFRFGEPREFIDSPDWAVEQLHASSLIITFPPPFPSLCEEEIRNVCLMELVE